MSQTEPEEFEIEPEVLAEMDAEERTFEICRQAARTSEQRESIYDRE